MSEPKRPNETTPGLISEFERFGEPHSLPSEPSAQVAAPLAPKADGSTLSLAESHARLTVSASKLGESVRAAKTRADEAVALHQKLRDELVDLERMLRAYDRVAHPRRRTPK